MSSDVDLQPELNDLDHARQMLSAGNYPQAELFLRRHLRFGGSATHAKELFSIIYQGYGLPEDFKLCEALAEDVTSKPKYLLIKAWGFGFWSDVHHVVGQLLLAELTHRIPIVHWGANSLFTDGSVREAYSMYFEPPSSVRVEDLPPDIRIFPPKWTAQNLLDNDVQKWAGPHSRMAAPYLFNREEDLVVSDFYMTIISLVPWISPKSRYFGKRDEEIYGELFAKYLKPAPSILAQVDAFFDTTLAGRPWVAVHARGSDKVHESAGLQQTNSRYFGFIDRIVELNPDIGVFLLTDSAALHAEFQKRYGERLATTAALRSTSDTGVHMQGHSGLRVGTEVLVDALLASRCDYFIGNQESNVSLAISSMKDWAKGLIFMLGDFNFRAENTFLHKRAPTELQCCRLCSKPVRFMYRNVAPGRQGVGYHQCSGCGALQTDDPQGLRQPHAETVKTDALLASHTLFNVFALPRLLDVLKVRADDTAVDYGGGAGLFARLMRDLGYNFHLCDPHGSAEYMQNYVVNEFPRKWRVVTLFNVASRFVNPQQDWAQVFACDPDWVIGNTPIYAQQDADWTELTHDEGRPAFYYSLESLAHIARTNGRFAYYLGTYFLFARTALDASALAAIQTWQLNLQSARRSAFEAWNASPYQHANADVIQSQAYAALRQHGKRIAIDGIFFRFSTGIARVWKRLFAHWATSTLAPSLVVIDRGRTAPRFAGIHYVDMPHYDFATPNHAQDSQLLQAICDQEDIGLFISTYYTTPVTTPSALLVLDMIPEVLAYDLSNPQWVGKKRAIEYAQTFLSISQSTENDLVRFYPQLQDIPKKVSYCGCDFRTANSLQVNAFKAKFQIQRPYFLLVGDRSGPKNSELFFKAFALLGEERSKFSIVCTLSSTGLEPEEARHVGDAQVHMVVLNDEELQSAYTGAIALAYPSRYEGFGLPVLEAMACSCPVITCNNSSIPEVGGDAVIYVDPDNVTQMYQALLDVQLPAARSHLVTKGLQQAKRFSWERMAREVGLHLAQWATRPHP
jgi:glycosyltransferase involved in cell wall biosynthesis